MGRVIVFDVIETSLDLAALDEHFERVFHEGAARQHWFVQMLQSALVATITHVYTDFGSVGRAALDMVAARRSDHAQRRRASANSRRGSDAAATP